MKEEQLYLEKPKNRSASEGKMKNVKNRIKNNFKASDKQEEKNDKKIKEGQ